MDSFSRKKGGLYIVHLSLHGLIRSKNIELGLNADTGGQVKYVVELLKELGSRDNVFMVDLITRRIKSNKYSKIYADKFEELGEKARIVRLNFGPEGYITKENLWPYINEFVKECLNYFKDVGRYPDIIHAHYADAGYAGAFLKGILNVPLIFTGHSLGRLKLLSLQGQGITEDEADNKYNIRTRISAEELVLATADLIIASTKQEHDEQYNNYKNIRMNKVKIIPPGVESHVRITKKAIFENLHSIVLNLKSFLLDTNRPCILAVARADDKKNLHSLVLAFSHDDFLRTNANLVILAGQRTKLDALESGARKVWTKLLRIIDDENLYGVVAYPKTHSHEDIPAYMDYARSTRGVFVNPALNEPFGLTLLEAGNAGLPVVATNKGGTVDIISKVKHGILVNPTNLNEISTAIKKIIMNEALWLKFSECGRSAAELYSWNQHVSTYLTEIKFLTQLASS